MCIRASSSRLMFSFTRKLRGADREITSVRGPQLPSNGLQLPITFYFRPHVLQNFIHCASSMNEQKIASIGFKANPENMKNLPLEPDECEYKDIAWLSESSKRTTTEVKDFKWLQSQEIETNADFKWLQICNITDTCFQMRTAFFVTRFVLTNTLAGKLKFIQYLCCRQ